MILKPRQKAFLEEYAQTSNIMQSAIKAGYSRNYAWKLGKRIVNTAIKAKAQDIIASVENKPLTKEKAKELLCEVIGIDRQLLTDTLKKIALQDKDYSSALKILSPLAKEAISLDITNQDTQTTTPSVLNIGIITDNTASNKDVIEGKVVE